MKPQAVYETDRGPALMDLIAAAGYLLGMAVVIGVLLFGFAWLLSAAS